MSIRLTTRQAGEILGCSGAAVADMVKRGELSDVSQSRPGTRHCFKLLEDQVRQLALTYRNSRVRATGNGHAPAPAATAAPQQFTESNSPLAQWIRFTPDVRDVLVALGRKHDVTVLHALLEL